MGGCVDIRKSNNGVEHLIYKGHVPKIPEDAYKGDNIKLYILNIFLYIHTYLKLNLSIRHNKRFTRTCHRF
jgi:predicted RNA-binding protein with RPS1 domain